MPPMLLTISDVGWGIVLALSCVAGVLLTMFRLPGTWLIVAAAGAFGWYEGWVKLTGTILGILVAIALVAEIIESIVSYFAVRRVGASRKAAVGGLIGGFAGMLLLSVPVPLIGTIFGALLGCFLGALFGEMLARSDLNLATRAGLVSALGFAFGAMLKTGAAIAMSGIVAWAAMFGPEAPAPQPEPSTPQPALTHSPDR